MNKTDSPFGVCDIYSGTRFDYNKYGTDDYMIAYKVLLNVADNSKVSYSSDGGAQLQVSGYYDLYGARFNENKELEIIPLGEYGDLNALSDDSYTLLNKQNNFSNFLILHRLNTRLFSHSIFTAVCGVVSYLGLNGKTLILQQA